MSTFSRKFYFQTTKHADDTAEKEISHQVLLKCDASLHRFWGWRKAAEHAPKRKVSSICCQERPRFGVRRCSAAFKNVLLDNWRKVVVNGQRVGPKPVDRTHQGRSCYAFKPSRRTPAILVRYKHQPMLYRVLMHIV